VYFKVPAGLTLHFQLLDEHYRALQTMRSFTGVMPGEQRGCLGCHEMHSTAVPNKAAAALRREAAELTPPPWGTKSISYTRSLSSRSSINTAESAIKATEQVERSSTSP